MTDPDVARVAVAKAIHDPGATEGYKGERSLTEWQTDAVMRVLPQTITDLEARLAELNDTATMYCRDALMWKSRLAEVMRQRDEACEQFDLHVAWASDQLTAANQQVERARGTLERIASVQVAFNADPVGVIETMREWAAAALNTEEKS